MGKGGGDAPPAPDPVATAQAQAAANKEAVRESAIVNQINEVTPYGELTYTGEIGDPDRTRVSTLNPADQQSLEQKRQLSETLGDYANTAAGYIPQDQFSLGGLPAVRSDFSQDAQQVEDATYDRVMGQLQPGFDRNRHDLEVNLSNRGLPVGSEAWKDAYSQLDQSQNQAMTDAALASVSAGRGEQSRMYGLESAERSRQLNESLLERQQPMNELAALLQGSPAIGGTQFGSTAQYQVAPPDISGLTNTSYNQQMNAYNQDQQMAQANMGGLYSLGAAGLMAFSDRRLKTDIVKLRELNGIPVYSFKYVWDKATTYVGYMAQDLLKLKPEAVFMTDSGFYAVDYSKV